MSLRIVVDEDVVPGVPPFQSYHHFGSEVLIDGLRDTGCIIINPSYVEKKFIQKPKSSVRAHYPSSYITGLKNIKVMTELSAYSNDFENTAQSSATVGSNMNSKKNKESQVIVTRVSVIVDISATVVKCVKVGNRGCNLVEEEDEDDSLPHQ